MHLTSHQLKILGCVIFCTLIWSCSRQPGKVDFWSFVTYNIGKDHFSSVTMIEGGQTIDIGGAFPGARDAVGVNGSVPKSVDFILVTQSGITHKMHRLVPEGLRTTTQYKIPEMYFVIKSADDVEVSRDDPTAAYKHWEVDVYNAADEALSIAVSVDGSPQLWSTNIAPGGGGDDLNFAVDTPDVVNVEVWGADKIKHMLHVAIPKTPSSQPVTNNRGPQVHFIIRGPDKVEVSFEKPKIQKTR